MELPVGMEPIGLPEDIVNFEVPPVPAWCNFRQKITPEEKKRREDYILSDRFKAFNLTTFDYLETHAVAESTSEELVIVETTTPPPLAASRTDALPPPKDPPASPQLARGAQPVDDGVEGARGVAVKKKQTAVIVEATLAAPQPRASPPAPTPKDPPAQQQPARGPATGVKEVRDVAVEKTTDAVVDKDDIPFGALDPADQAVMAERTLALNLAYLGNASNAVLERIVDVGSVLAPGTPEAELLMMIMDVVCNMDSSIALCQQAIVHTGLTAMNAARISAAERNELAQARRDRAAWQRERAAMEEQLAVLARSREATTPSSGFSSAAPSPHSVAEGGGSEETATGSHGRHRQLRRLAEMDVDGEELEEEEEVEVEMDDRTLQYPALTMPPPKPERSKRVLFTAASPQLMGEHSPTFQDSLRLHRNPSLRAASTSFLDDSIVLSDSPEQPNEGPLCSTFVDGDRLVYTTPQTSKKLRRRSSSIGDAMSTMKRLFTPKRKVKNPILEGIIDK